MQRLGGNSPFRMGRENMTPQPAKALAISFENAQAKLVTQTADLPLGTLAEMVDAQSIDLEPAFQRRERWSPERQSALIESFLLNVPVPPVYLSEEPSGTYTAIDGKQRLRAIADFLGNRLKLKKLERLTSAEGFTFKNLPTEIQNSFKLRPFIRVVTLLKQTDRTLKYEVFLRLNRGGEQLNNQEIRNVAFRGPLMNAIGEAAKNLFFRQQLKIINEKSTAYKNMEDNENVLRFLTLNDRLGKFSGSFSREMDDFAEMHQDAPKQEIRKLLGSFATALERCEAVWGNCAFKRPEKGNWRDQFLVGMFDAQMLSCVRLSPNEFEVARARKKRILSETILLFKDEQFDTAVRAGTNTPARIDYRVKKIREILVQK